MKVYPSYPLEYPLGSGSSEFLRTPVGGGDGGRPGGRTEHFRYMKNSAFFGMADFPLFVFVLLMCYAVLLLVLRRVWMSSGSVRMWYRKQTSGRPAYIEEDDEEEEEEEEERNRDRERGRQPASRDVSKRARVPPLCVVYVLEAFISLVVLGCLLGGTLAMLVGDWSACGSHILDTMAGVWRVAAILCVCYTLNLTAFPLDTRTVIHHLSVCALWVAEGLILTYLPITHQPLPGRMPPRGSVTVDTFASSDYYFQLVRSFLLLALLPALDAPLFVCLLAHTFHRVSARIYTVQAVYYAITRLLVTVAIVHAYIMSLVNEISPSAATFAYAVGFPLLVGVFMYTQVSTAISQFRIARKLRRVSDGFGARASVEEDVREEDEEADRQRAGDTAQDMLELEYVECEGVCVTEREKAEREKAEDAQRNKEAVLVEEEAIREDREKAEKAERAKAAEREQRKHAMDIAPRHVESRVVNLEAA